MQFDFDGPAKVIKGEIHNVLSIIRADPRYVSPLRFTQEIPEHNFISDNNNKNNNNNNNNGYNEAEGNDNHKYHKQSGHQHPLIKSLRDLSEKLTSIEASDYCYDENCMVQKNGSIPGNIRKMTDDDVDLDVVIYVSPFATAVISREISGPITGASLSSLHKFLLYGFISIDSPRAKEGITMIARCIRHCTFEETESSKSANANGRGIGTSSRTSTGLFSARDRSHKRDRNFNSNRNTANNTNSAMNIHDEEVVMKLLSLSALVIRCEAGEMLEPRDVVGIFETCLHVNCHARNASSLLRSAAGDTLKHIVLVLFGRGSITKPSPSEGNLGLGKLFHDNLDNSTQPKEPDEDQLSDDLWAEANLEADDEISLYSINSFYKAEIQSSGTYEYSKQRGAPLGPKNNTKFSKPPNKNSQTHSPSTNNGTNMHNETQNAKDSNGSKTSVPSEVSNLVARQSNNSPAIVTILQRLAQLACPRQNQDTTCIQSLSLINIALETGAANQLFVKCPDLLSILQNDLCRHLLQLSTHVDLVILSLTLRVIFNLFNSIKNHLKIQLEVFLTSVQLRILNRESSSPEQKELALESLLEFCHEPALMHDLYMNYDCDMQCTNLFETICKVLANHASPKVIVFEDDDEEGQGKGMISAVPLNGLNRLALEGILAVVDSIAKRCHSPSKDTYHDPNKQENGYQDYQRQNHHSKINGNDTLYLNEHNLNKLIESDSQTVSTSESIASSPMNSSEEKIKNNWIHHAREKTAQVLMERKKRKHQRSLVVEKFNKHPTDKEWVTYGESLGVLPKPATAKSIATFLYTTPNLDKAGIGLYISKGPIEKYPFHHEVCIQFVSLFSFKGMEFSEALRVFLLKFQLPGEAQCIDRLMEAFATELYSQQENENNFLFKNSDAAFILAFATIMLNTDLHNPNMRDDRRMTLEQFIRTNRGLNGGEDFPEEFLKDLYIKIKSEEIQVQKDLSECNDESLLRFGFLSKATQVATPFFTPAETARRTFIQAGVHERDMFTTIFSPALECISSVFVRSWDDALVVKALRGLQQMAAICAYFNMDEKFNEILRILLGYGRDYISSCLEIIDDVAGWDKEEIEESSIQSSSSSQIAQIAPRHYYYTPEDHGPVDNSEYFDEDVPIPFALLESMAIPNAHNCNRIPIINNSQLYDDVVSGSAGHRGLLSLHCAFTLVLAQTFLVREAWSSVVESVFLLRDANALPRGVGDLDDFADCHGNILPDSPFATRSKQRVNAFFSGDQSEDDSGKGLWENVASIFASSKNTQGESDVNATEETDAQKLRDKSFHVFSEGLVKVSHAAQFDQIFIRSKEKLFASQMLRTLLDARDLGDQKRLNSDINHPLFEHHAVFALELATRALLWNRRHANDLFPLFRSKLETILLLGSDHVENGKVQTPFLMERAVVTILRAFIHLYDIPQIKTHLLSLLSMLNRLPSAFMNHVADRFGCGMAIILRGTYLQLETEEEWIVVSNLLDAAANMKGGRGFVFDGIASCVENSIPNDIDSVLNVKSKDDDSFMTLQCATVLVKLLCKFTSGAYENDKTFSSPAMFCLDKVYNYQRQVKVRDSTLNGSKKNMHSPDLQLWESVLAAFTFVSLSTNSQVALKGLEKLQRFLFTTEIDDIPDSSWFMILDLLSSKHPSVQHEQVRIKSLDLLVRMLLVHVPKLCKNKDNLDRLKSIIDRMAAMTAENLSVGRQGNVSSLFESTVQLVTNLSNVLLMPEFAGEENFGVWASNTLFEELEKVGAGGGSARMIKATSIQGD